MRVLSKSRFKLGLECPNKLYYTSKEEYPNSKEEDSFLRALAQGGFQVEELARMHYPEGILIEGNDGEYKKLWEQTKKLLEQENVIIYEAAFLHNGLFVRTDILVKRGNSIELIEVKAKAYDPKDKYLFIGKRGGLVSKWRPYLYDVAFQNYVIQNCFPDWTIKSLIMMADKTKKASINGLNQLFRISEKVKGRTGIIKKVKSLNETGSSVLGLKNITSVIQEIQEDKYPYLEDHGFKESIRLLHELYEKDTFCGWKTNYSTCRKCEFKCSDDDASIGKQSGFQECFKKIHGLADSDFKKPNIFDIYDFRKGGEILNQGVIFKSDLTEQMIGLKIEAEKLTTSHRQWLQIEKEVKSDETIYVDKSGLKHEIDSWNFPLHFIDFETSMVALPFHQGMSPYEQVAFQFSHHIYHEDGRVEHASEYINNTIGEFPNFHFIRALKDALEIHAGSIFRYANHENTVLNAIHTQLLNSSEPDKNDLIGFIQGISHSSSGSDIKWSGERDMIDLLDVLKKFYFNPLAKGSNSIKDILPAALNSSDFLRSKYVKPIKEINLTSRNFPSNHVWLKFESDKAVDPYHLLPYLFESWTEEQMEDAISEMDEIHDGSAALVAYGKMQYTDMTKAEIDELSSALLQYCELDTLAMVMIYEHFRELIE